MYTKIPDNFKSKKLKVDEIKIINNRLIILNSKVNNVNKNDVTTIFGPNYIHVDIIKDSIERLIILILSNVLYFASVYIHLNAIEKYYQLTLV